MEPVVSQKAVIKKGSKYLVLERNHDDLKNPFPGLWDFPGGKLEEGEDLLESVRREAREEIGCDVAVTKKIAEYDIVIHKPIYFIVHKPVHFVFYDAEIVSGIITLGAEHVSYNWLPKEDILKLPMMPYMKQFLTEHG